MKDFCQRNKTRAPPRPLLIPLLNPASKMKALVLFSRVQLFATPLTVAHQAPLSMGILQQKYWSGLPFPSSGDLPDPGIEPGSPASQALSLPSEPPGKPREAKCLVGKTPSSGQSFPSAHKPSQSRHGGQIGRVEFISIHKDGTPEGASLRATPRKTRKSIAKQKSQVKPLQNRANGLKVSISNASLF